MIHSPGGTTEIRNLTELLVLATAGAALAGLAIDLPPGPAFLANLALVCLGPGYAVLGPRGTGAYGLAGLIATSLSVSTVLTLAMLYSGAWRPALMLGALAAISVTGVLGRRLADLSRRLSPPR